MIVNHGLFCDCEPFLFFCFFAGICKQGTEAIMRFLCSGKWHFLFINIQPFFLHWICDFNGGGGGQDRFQNDTHQLYFSHSMESHTRGIMFQIMICVAWHLAQLGSLTPHFANALTTVQMLTTPSTAEKARPLGNKYITEGKGANMLLLSAYRKTIWK